MGGRIAFVHQSVTEYLAAMELARRYQVTPQILKEKLTLTRWDQALFLALSILPPSHSEAFFNDVVRTDLALALDAVKAHASKRRGIAKASLLFCIADAEVAPIFEALHELAGMSPEQRMQQPTHLLKQMDRNWGGNEALFVQLLRLRESHLALAVIGPVHVGQSRRLGQLEIGDIDWWLDWMIDEKAPSSNYWLNERLSWLFAAHLSKEAQQASVSEFNSANSKYRKVLASSILLYQNDLTTDDFSADAISFLLADLGQPEMNGSFRGNLLGVTATEKFVSERLLPLIPDSKDLLLSNLRHVLRIAGTRHGRRYSLD